MDWALRLTGLRAPDRKYQKSHDRSVISDLILFHLNVPFGELFSKITIKSSAALSFFKKIRKVEFTASRSLQPPGEGRKSRIFSKLAHNKENYSRYSIPVASKSFYYLSKSVKMM